jgi:hypothetical protein
MLKEFRSCRSSGVAGVQELQKERQEVAAFMTYANNVVTNNFSASGPSACENPVL